MPVTVVALLLLLAHRCEAAAPPAASACRDSSPGVCCEDPAGTCGVAACPDYAKIVPGADPSRIRDFGCGGAAACCFYPAPGGLYCQSCAKDGNGTRPKPRPPAPVPAPSPAPAKGVCRDSSPGVCCNDPAGTCGLAACSDYAKIDPAADPARIENFGCGGAAPCCFYAAPGGRYCQSCAKEERCQDPAPGRCCRKPAGVTCGVAACSDYRKVAPGLRPEDIHGYGCGGAAGCCFYYANGGAYCESCTAASAATPGNASLVV